MSIKKRFFTIATALFLAVAVLALCAPVILSSHWAKHWLLSVLNRDIPGSLNVESLSVSWLGPQKIEGVHLLGPNGEEVASLQSLSVDVPLFALFSDPPPLKEIRLKALHAVLGDSLAKSLGMDFIPRKGERSDTAMISNMDLIVGGSADSLMLEAYGNTHHNGKAGKFSFECFISQRDSRMKADVVNFPVEILDLLAALKSPDSYGLVSTILGRSLNIVIDEDSASSSGSSHLAVNLHTDRVRLEIEGRITEGNFTLLSPSVTKIALTPEAFAKLNALLHPSSTFQLTRSMKIALNVQEIRIPLEFFHSGLTPKAMHHLAFDAALALPLFEWQADGKKSALTDFQFTISTLPDRSFWDLSMTGHLLQEGKNFPFVFKSSHRMPESSKEFAASLIQPHEMLFSLQNLNTTNLDAFFGTGKHWQQVFGPTVSLQMTSHDHDLQTLQASLKSDKIDIPKLVLSIDEEFELGNQKQVMSGKVYSDAIHFKNQKSSLNTFEVKWEADFSEHNFQAVFSGNTVFTGESESGTIYGSVFIDQRQTHSSPIFRVDLTGMRVPAPLLSLATGRNEWGLLFGPSIDLQVKAGLQGLSGSFVAKVDGLNGKLAIDGQLTQGIVTLNSPFHISTRATSEIGKGLLADFSAVFKELISAENFISLDIDPDMFSIPLSLKYSEMHFKSAVLNLGKMTLRNGGDVHRLLSALKAGSPQQVEIWTTPMYLRMEQGKLTIYRVDMLVGGRYPMAAWGRIDLPNDKVNMVLGLSPIALAQSFGITGLPKDYLFQIPIKGSTASTKVESGKVMSRMGALIAQSNGGPEGVVLGKVLDIANGKEPKIPPPTTKPLPWGGLIAEREQKTRNTEYKNPVNEMRKEAAKFLKGVFK